MKQPLRIPTLLALFILIVGLGSAIFLMENFLAFFSWAKNSPIPKNISISNVTDTSLSVSWATTASTTGTVTYKEKGFLTPQFLALDARDQNQIPRPYQMHYVTLTGLKPKTDYEITLITGKNQKQPPVIAATGPYLSPPPTQKDPAYGRLVFDKLFTKEVLVLGSFSGSQTLSGLVRDDGSFILPLNFLRSADLKKYYPAENDDRLTLNFTSFDKSSTVVSDSHTWAPLPTIKLGENYDFSSKSARPAGLIIAAGNSTNKTLALVNTAFSLTLPRAGSAIPSQRPEFKGTGVPAKFVYLTIKTGQVVNTGQTQVDSSGNWRFSPKTDLPAGQTLAVATSYNQNGAAVAQSVSFIILKSGTSVLGEATPSASLNPSPSASSLPSPSPSKLPSPSPSSSATPLTSATPSAITTPVSGNAQATLGLVFLGIAFLILGGVVIFSKI